MGSGGSQLAGAGLEARALWTVLRRGGRQLAAELLGAWAPARCAACAQVLTQPSGRAPGLCARCRSGLLPMVPAGAPACSRCGEALPSAGVPCPGEHRELVGIRFAAARWWYRGTCGGLVRRLKFRGEPGALSVLGQGMGAALQGAVERQAAGPRGAGGAGAHVKLRRGRAVVVPVPLHRSRRRQRRWDQARLLAVALGEGAGLPVASALARVRPTLPQGDPRVTDRSANVAGAFRCRHPTAVQGRWVVLVDDVVTSGATARACARELMAAGSAGVVLLSAARARRWS